MWWSRGADVSAWAWTAPCTAIGAYASGSLRSGCRGGRRRSWYFAGEVAIVAVLCVRVFVVEVNVVVAVEVVMSVAERCSPCHVCGCRR